MMPTFRAFARSLLKSLLIPLQPGEGKDLGLPINLTPEKRILEQAQEVIIRWHRIQS